MELLEGVVRQHDGVDLLGDSQEKRIAAPDRSGGRVDVLALDGRLLEVVELGRVYPVRKGGVDNHRHLGLGVLPPQLGDRLFQLVEAGRVAPLGRNIRSVDN